MSNKYNYNLEGTQRKAFVSIVSEILGEPAVYQRAPSFSYQIGCYSVSKTGVLSCSDETDPERLSELVRELEGRGYTAEADNAPDTMAAAEPTAQTNEAETNEVESEDVETERTIAPEPKNTERENSLTIELPLDDFDEDAYSRLTQIIASKETLLKKALGADDLSVVIKEGILVFPWFTLHDIEGEADAYTRFVAALVKMAKTQKRVTAKAKDITNDKFTMRLFLIRLGFIGDEYKTARKILLRNLTGNSSWKAGKPPEKPQEARVEGETEPVAPAEPALAEATETEAIQTENTNQEGEHLMIKNDFPDQKTIEQVRRKYPENSRVELVKMADPFSRLVPGDRGTVRFVDDAGTIHVRWDNGEGLGVINGVDKVRKV